MGEMGPVVIEVEEPQKDNATLPYCLSCLAAWIGCLCLCPESLLPCFCACLADRAKRNGFDVRYKVYAMLSIVFSAITIIAGILAWILFFIHVFPIFYRAFWWH